MHMKYPHTLTA